MIPEMLLWCELQCTRLVSRPCQHFLRCLLRGKCCGCSRVVIVIISSFLSLKLRTREASRSLPPPSPPCTQIKKFLAQCVLECGTPFPVPEPSCREGGVGSLGLGTRVSMGEGGTLVHPFRALACLRPLKCCGRGETVLRAHTDLDPGYHLPEPAY